MQEGGSKRHFLKIANFSKTRRGLKPIRYATTVCNNGRPRNKESYRQHVTCVYRYTVEKYN